MPPYRLQTLLEMRERAEEEAKQAFSDAVKAAEQEKQALAGMIESLERKKVERKAKVQAYMQEVMAKGGGVSGLQQLQRFEERLKDEEAQAALDIERQREVVEQAEQLVEQRRTDMAEAAKEKKAIEKHKENWTAEIRKERQAREELSIEEIGSALHQQRARNERKK